MELYNVLEMDWLRSSLFLGLLVGVSGIIFFTKFAVGLKSFKKLAKVSFPISLDYEIGDIS